MEPSAVEPSPAPIEGADASVVVAPVGTEPLAEMPPPSNQSLEPEAEASPPPSQSVRHLTQNGPIGEVGVNGVTNEALLAIIIDRLRSFESGPFTCEENRHALTLLDVALRYLNHRTARRVVAGVEGTHEGN